MRNFYLSQLRPDSVLRILEGCTRALGVKDYQYRVRINYADINALPLKCSSNLKFVHMERKVEKYILKILVSSMHEND